MNVVEPIRDRSKIDAIKWQLKDNARYLCFFALGINTALRPGDLLALTAGDVYTAEGEVKTILNVRAQKTHKQQRIKINKSATEALSNLWKKEGPLDPSRRLFSWTRQHAWRLVKRWCNAVGLSELYGAHSLRKTWGYQARMAGVSLDVIQAKLGHSAPSVTRRYIGITADEIENAEDRVNL